MKFQISDIQACVVYVAKAKALISCAVTFADLHLCFHIYKMQVFFLIICNKLLIQVTITVHAKLVRAC